MDIDRLEKWQHDKFQSDDRGGKRGRGAKGDASTGAKIIVGNLDYKVTHGDINVSQASTNLMTDTCKAALWAEQRGPSAAITSLFHGGHVGRSQHRSLPTLLRGETGPCVGFFVGVARS